MPIEGLINFALRRRLLIVIIGLAVLAGGIYSWRQLEVEAQPNISPTLVQVFTVTEGLAPEEVEKYVTYPVERSMTGLPNVDEIRSTSNFGLSVVTVYFEPGTDMYFARQVVGERLPKANEQIPQGFGQARMGPISTGQGLILYYYLDAPNADYSLTELRTMQDWIIKPELETVRGVTEVLGIGGYQKQYQVNLNPDALQRYGLTIDEVVAEVNKSNLNVGAQFLNQRSEQFVVRSEGLAKGIPDLKSITVKTADGRPIHLKDIGDVEIGGKIRQGLQTLNGEREVVSGMVMQLYESDTSAVIKRVEERVAKIQESLPEGVKIVPYYDQGELVNNAVDTVTNALIQGIGLVILVLFVFMGAIRPSIVVATAIPFSVLFAVMAMQWFGISANIMSLGGLAIAIGLMVDGTVVMVENVDSHLRDPAAKHERRIDIVGRACREVAQPLLFAITIIVVVFLPLFTLTGVAGKMFAPLAYTVSLAMGASLIYALLQAPVLSDLIMRAPSGRAGPVTRLLARLRGNRGDADSDGQQAGSETPQRTGWLMRGFMAIVGVLVRQRWLAVGLALALLAGGAALFPRLETEFTPRMEEGDIIVNLTMAPSIALPETKRQTMIAEKRILEVPAVKKVVSRIGRGEVGAHADPINSVHALVVLKERSQWQELGFADQAAIEAAIRDKLKGMPGILPNMTQPIQLSVDELISGSKGELAIKLFGEDLDKLKATAEEIAAVMRGIPGAADVQTGQVTGRPQVRIRPDREAMARYGVDMATVQNTIRTAIGGEVAGQIFQGIRRFEVYVRYQEPYRDDPEAIGHTLVSVPGGKRVPLAQLATIETIIGPRQISREDAQRFITIQANSSGRGMGSIVAEAKPKVREQVELPTGYFIEWGGQYELQQKANARFAVVIPVTLGLVCILLYASFGSVRNTLLILLNIPLALVGGVAALWLGGLNLSVPSSIGFIALFGIALENGMVLVTYMNQLVRSGTSLAEASIKGAARRVRPVLMTAVTTSLGLLPLLFASGAGSDVQRPLAAVVVGGLVTSTVLTLLVLPALYKWFAVQPSHDRPGWEEDG
jgi:cobalt-zinc-cadmium resistance protein CzcA